MTITLLAAFLGYVFGFAVSGWLASERDHAISARVNVVERKLDLIMDHFEIDYDPGVMEIDSLIASGMKIEAIKRYRELTRVGLREAKDAIEDRERILKIPVPTRSDDADQSVITKA